MLRIGCHLSSAKGYLAMGKEAVAIGANTFQFFTRNPRGGRAKELDLADIEAYLEFAKVQGIGQILAHAPYTLNACSKDQGLRQFAYETMCDDLNRLQYLPEAMYNFHPGSHVKQGVEQGISYIVELLNRINEQDRKTIMLLETMAGKGSEVGQSFEELQTILEKVEDSRLLGVCLDTCYVFDAGYDIVHSLEDVLEEFDKIIGMERLMAVHLNDSKNARGSHKDRHEKIGEGQIGLEAFVRIVTHPKLNKLPFYLETPNDLEGYQQEIAWLREKAEYEET